LNLKDTKSKHVKSSSLTNRNSHKIKPDVKQVKGKLIYEIARIPDYSEPSPPSDKLDIYHFEYPEMDNKIPYNQRTYVKEPKKTTTTTKCIFL
jgi:hypothetical protein